MKRSWKALKPGDRVRLLHVPAADVEQRERELQGDVELPGWTADTIERILGADPVVTIDRIDEFGAPWFEYKLVGADNDTEHHSLSITDDESWEYE